MNMDLLLCRRHYSHKIFLLWMTLQCLLRALFLLYLIKIYCWDIIFSIFYAKNYQVCLGSQTQIAFIRFQQRLVLLLSRTFFLFSYLFCIPCGKKKIWVMPPPARPKIYQSYVIPLVGSKIALGPASTGSISVGSCYWVQLRPNSRTQYFNIFFHTVKKK